MPSSMVPLMVDLDAVAATFGCKDQALFARIQKKAKLDTGDTDPDDYEVVDEEDEEVDTDEIEELPSSLDALEHILMGEPWARGIGSKYGYAFMAICEHLGKKLDRDHWGETRGEYVEAFDRVLAKLKIPPDVLSVALLTNALDGRFTLPPRGDFPFIGSLTAEQARDAGAAMAAVDRAALEAASARVKISRGAIEPAFVVGSFDEIRGWCEACAAAGKGLIVFYH